MRVEEKDLVDQVIRNSRRNYQMEKYMTIDTEMETLIYSVTKRRNERSGKCLNKSTSKKLQIWLNKRNRQIAGSLLATDTGR